MAEKKKKGRVIVILECTEQDKSKGGPISRYYTYKNKQNTKEKLELRKYNPYLKKHTIHREIGEEKHQ